MSRQPVMAPVRVPKSKRTLLAGSDKIEVEEPSQPESPSSEDNQVTRLATEMQREVFYIRTSANEAKTVDSLIGQKASRGSTHCHYQCTSGSSEEDRECNDIKI